MSIQPLELTKILNEEKIIEIRKTFPKGQLPVDVYLCCTKKGGSISRGGNGLFFYRRTPKSFLSEKIVAKFTLSLAEPIVPQEKNINDKVEVKLATRSMNEESLLKASCMTWEELFTYRNFMNGELIKKPKIAAWHIEKLVAFDEPLELTDFYRKKKINGKFLAIDNGVLIYGERLKSIPQNWRYVWKERKV